MSVLNALSVDVEEWFHVCRAEGYVPRSGWGGLPARAGPLVDGLLRLFEARGARATFFMLGYVADRAPDMPRRIEAAGHEVGLHGYWHVRADDLGPAAFEEDVRRGLEAVGSRVRAPVRGFRAPEWSISSRTPWAYEALAAHGLGYDSSVLPFRFVFGNGAARWPHRIDTRRGAIWEFPASTLSWPGGHGPFTSGSAVRLLPARIVGRGIRALNRRGHPANLNLHPWELDPEPPMARLPPVRGVLHRVGLAGTAQKLDRLLREFRFGPVGEVLRRLQSQSALI